MLLLVLGLNVVTIYAIVQTKATAEVHLLLYYLDKLNLLADPRLNRTEILTLCIFSLILAVGSVDTFRWRKSYLD